MRTTSAAAAPPNSSSIGGAGTGVGPSGFPGGGFPCELPFELHPPFELQPLLDDPFDEEDVDEEVLVEPEVDDELLVETLPLDDEDVDEDTSPLDDAEDETFPLDEEDTFPLDDDETFPLLPPDADEVLLVLDTPPVLVDDPPDEVEDEVAPDEVELDEPPEPPDEVEVEPPLVLDVEDTTIPLDPPPEPPPPKNPPAKKPPPMPPPPVPPTSTGPPPKPPPLTIGAMSAPVKAGGRGTGAAWLATVTTVGGHTVLVRVTTRVTTRCRAGRGAARLVMARFVIARFVISRFCADSATCTAPPPTTAPPQAQAQSFAKAIFTDMPSQSSPRTLSALRRHRHRFVLRHQGETKRKIQPTGRLYLRFTSPRPDPPAGPKSLTCRKGTVSHTEKTRLTHADGGHFVLCSWPLVKPPAGRYRPANKKRGHPPPTSSGKLRGGELGWLRF